MNAFISMFTKSSKNAKFTVDSFKSVFRRIANGTAKYNLTSKTGQKCVHTLLMKEMETRFLKFDIPGIMKSFSIGTPEDLAAALVENVDYLQTEQHLTLNRIILEKGLTSKQKKGKALVDVLGGGLNPYEDEVTLDDVERYVVVRTKYGTHEPKMYTITGSLTTETADAVKAMYAYESGCNYYEARPILFTTWTDLPDEYKMASRPCEEDDLRYVNE